MTQSGPMILREARTTAGLSQKQLSYRMECVSEGTIKRWEYGESRPDSADVARMGELLGDDTLWPRWMCATDEEYARRHPFTVPAASIEGSVLRVHFEADEVKSMLAPILKDLLDGKIDNTDFAQRFARSLRDLENASREARERIRKGG